MSRSVGILVLVAAFAALVSARPQGGATGGGGGGAEKPMPVSIKQNPFELINAHLTCGSELWFAGASVQTVICWAYPIKTIFLPIITHHVKTIFLPIRLLIFAACM